MEVKARDRAFARPPDRGRAGPTRTTHPGGLFQRAAFMQTESVLAITEPDPIPTTASARSAMEAWKATLRLRRGGRRDGTR
jgi:hypothetical protein